MKLHHLQASALLLALGSAHQTVAFPQPLAGRAASDASSSSSSAATSTSVSTAVPSASAAPGTQIVKASIPPRQVTCLSKIYCPGSEILQDIQLAGLFPDSKTFVDKPARYPTQQILSSFKNLTSGSNYTIGSLTQWVEDNFLGEGLDLVPVSISDFKENPAFLKGIKDKYVRGWLKIVNSYWASLARKTVPNTKCSQCESTQIQLNHSFVVPGGRFRENYYWDSYWILEGLLVSEIYSLAKTTILNFLDEIDTIGYIPNGARKYYLNRSQPPLFTQMLNIYLEKTNDTSILSRALPLVEKELKWWQTNRTSTVKSSYSGKTHTVSFYNVTNSAPRPEGYAEDYETAWGDTIGQNTTGFDLSKRSLIYKNLATGAESGQDYSAARWAREPLLNTSSNLPSLRTLNNVQQVPVDLNSILYSNMEILSKLYLVKGSTYNAQKSQAWAAKAQARRAAVLDLNWDKSRLGFYDYNVTGQAYGKYWTATSYFPYWLGIYPPEVLSSEANAQKAFAGLGYLTGARYNGTLPHSLLETGFQWDFPSSWPALTWVAAKAVEGLPSNVTKSSFGSFGNKVSNFSFIPPGHFGLKNEEDLPPQNRVDGSANFTSAILPFGTVGNIGNLNVTKSKTWKQGLAIAIANRYTAAAFCSWYATAGSIPGLLGRLPDEALNATKAINNTDGNMFEKFSTVDLDAAGGGGEYTVQIGFGWTNGVALYFGQHYGPYLATPVCPDISFQPPSNGTSNSTTAQGRRMFTRDMTVKRAPKFY